LTNRENVYVVSAATICRLEGLSILKRETADPSEILVNIYEISVFYVPENINSNI
jgi:hypothetical protein